jgi:hypothetical protein
MESIGKNRTAWLALGMALIAMFAASRLTGGPQGPVCVELPAEQPGFSALAAGVNPACVRIRLR